MENKDITSVGLLKIASLLTRLSKKLEEAAEKIRFSEFKQRFGQQEDDIYIVTYPKSGTTLMQMIVYQLTTDGDTNFNHIYEVSPWIRNACHRGEEIPNVKSPRIIKSHDLYKDFEKGTKGRFIHVHRNAEDVAVSMYHQTKNYKKPDLDLEEYIHKTFLGQKDYNWFKYSKEWFNNKKKFNILYLRYENLINNKETEIRRIADFLNINLTDEVLTRTLECSSFDFMKQHEKKFGLQPPEKVKKFVFDEFIRKGKVGEGNQVISEKQKELINERYVKEVKNIER